jgi:uncharacterized membrane protein YdjX (TVP38/TMEM64 family)
MSGAVFIAGLIVGSVLTYLVYETAGDALVDKIEAIGRLQPKWVFGPLAMVLILCVFGLPFIVAYAACAMFGLPIPACAIGE